ncbi:MAG: N-6 DNA methylase [Candidatus Hodarchaeota archaeon]
MAKKKKREALTVTRLINEVLVSQLSIPLRQIVNDTSFIKYTGSKRPDILISEFEFDSKNEDQFIKNLVAYAEVKDECSFNDKDWKDAIKQAKEKSKKLNLPYFIITNCKKSVFYNAITLKEITLNQNPIREFQTIDILRLIKNRLLKNENLSNIQTNVDSISTISEAIFNKKLWELAGIYRGISFKDNIQKIDFTIGFVSLEFFEEKEILENKKDNNKIYWADCADDRDEKLVGNLSQYIKRLENDTEFREFQNLMESVRLLITGKSGKSPLIDSEEVQKIYEIIDSMRPLHGCGFDLFGAVYEMFASSKEKKDFGEYFTKRHYAHIFSKLLLKNEQYYNKEKEFTILDPACGTGGFLTESFKVLKNNYEKSDTFNKNSRNFLSKKCFYGIDVREENISRTKLNMFLVGDGHTNMYSLNTLKHDFKSKTFDYVITNPPYGSGTIKADTTSLSSNRTEIAFLCRIIKLLNIGGKACVITPDGILENPSFKEFRKELLEKCEINAIVSLPKFAFAPYTKEKTYAFFFMKRSEKNTKPQKKPIWMYIIDNDGLANSDKRFPTKLRNNRNGWMHDEISGWVSTDGEEMYGLLEERWMVYDDEKDNGTQWINEKGIEINLRKGGFVDISNIINDKYHIFLPEYYLRPFEPHFITKDELMKERKRIENIFLNNILQESNYLKNKNSSKDYFNFQIKNIPISKIIDYMNGNSGLTEQAIYQKMQHPGKRYIVLSSSTEENTQMGEIPICEINGKLLKVFKDKEGLLVIRNGKAGTTIYLPKGNYTINDHAYILFVKKDCPYKIHLKWLSIQYKNEFLSYSSSSDNGTWNMTGFFNNVIIDIPDYKEQLEIIDQYEKLELYENKTKEIYNKINDLKKKSIII